MLAHRLRHRVTVQSYSTTQDPVTGDLVSAWTDFKADVPAEVLTGPGKESTAAGTTQSEVAARINMRWFSGLKTSMRIVWDGQYFNILSIATDITARQEYRLVCSAGTSKGV